MNKLLLLLLVLFSFPSSGKAQESGHGLLCDTESQVEQFLAFLVESKDPTDAVSQVNREAKSTTACIFSYVVFMRGKEVASISVKEGIAKVTEISVIGYKDGQEWKLVTPFTQYTVFLVKGTDI